MSIQAAILTSTMQKAAGVASDDLWARCKQRVGDGDNMGLSKRLGKHLVSGTEFGPHRSDDPSGPLTAVRDR